MFSSTCKFSTFHYTSNSLRFIFLKDFGYQFPRQLDDPSLSGKVPTEIQMKVIENKMCEEQEEAAWFISLQSDKQ